MALKEKKKLTTVAFCIESYFFLIQKMTSDKQFRMQLLRGSLSTFIIHHPLHVFHPRHPRLTVALSHKSFSKRKVKAKCKTFFFFFKFICFELKDNCIIFMKKSFQKHCLVDACSHITSDYCDTHMNKVV